MAVEKTETEIQSEIMKFLESQRWDVYRLNSGRKGGMRLHKAGTPDLLVMKNGTSIFIEVKKEGENPTKIQEKEHDRIRQNGFKVFVVHSVLELKSYSSKHRT